MGVDITKLTEPMQTKLREFVAACADDPSLTSFGYQVVITEGRRRNIVQARYFCHGRTPKEIQAWLDHVKADGNQIETIKLALGEFLGLDWDEEKDPRVPGRIITNALPYTGPHCLGVAFHARVKLGERVLMDADTPWQTLGKISRRCGLVWGGDWHLRDLEHHELPKALWPKPEPAQVAA